jgi:hypothetical protein
LIGRQHLKPISAICDYRNFDIRRFWVANNLRISQITQMITVSDRIIDALGGTTAVSRKAETPLSTVHSWRKNGIPASRLAHLKLIASAEGIAIDWDTGERLDHDDSDTARVSASSSDSSRQIIGQVAA